MTQEISLNGRLCGRIEEGKFFTFRQPNHVMRKWGAFGVSEIVLKRLKNQGISEVVIEYGGVRGTKKFKSHVDDFLNSQYIHVFEKFDKQYFIPIKQMEELT